VPATIDEVLDEADRLLEPDRFQDYCVNGLQVPGPLEVRTLASGVSASLELFRQAADADAQLVIVHHGLFWGAGVRRLDGALMRRLQALFDADMALAAYHLPLDAHPQLGNNALLARELGGKTIAPFALHNGEPIGFIAHIGGEGVAITELASRLCALTAREPLVFDFGPPGISRIAVVSGAGADYLGDAADAGAQALLTGEVPERAMADARELGLHLIAAGHYATETFGIRALGEHLATRFGLRHVFLDVPNPI